MAHTVRVFGLKKFGFQGLDFPALFRAARPAALFVFRDAIRRPCLSRGVSASRLAGEAPLSAHRGVSEDFERLLA